MQCPQKVRHFLGAFLWEREQNMMIIFGNGGLKKYCLDLTLLVQYLQKWDSKSKPSVMAKIL